MWWSCFRSLASLASVHHADDCLWDFRQDADSGWEEDPSEGGVGGEDEDEDGGGGLHN